MPRPKKPKAAKDVVWIIRDVRDGSRDYLMPRTEADALYIVGKLVMVNVYSGRWDYMEA